MFASFKSGYKIRSVRLSAWQNSSPAAQIFVKIYCHLKFVEGIKTHISYQIQRSV